jgi:hypothetical protein
MRGNRQPSLRSRPTETQVSFTGLSRGRRSKLAKAAQTTLTKAHQWARGESVDAAVAEALEAQVKGLKAKKK